MRLEDPSMKKMFAMMLSLMIALSLTACSTEDTTSTGSGLLVNADEGSADAGETIAMDTEAVYTIDGSDAWYYRSPLLALVPDQGIDYVSQGEDAYAYQVTLADAPEGTFIADADGNEVADGIFGLDVGSGSHFYIYVPMDAEEEMLTVVAKTTTFFRLDEESDTLVEDNISDSVTLSW